MYIYAKCWGLLSTEDHFLHPFVLSAEGPVSMVEKPSPHSCLQCSPKVSQLNELYWWRHHHFSWKIWKRMHYIFPKILCQGGFRLKFHQYKALVWHLKNRRVMEAIIHELWQVDLWAEDRYKVCTSFQASSCEFPADTNFLRFYILYFSRRLQPFSLTFTPSRSSCNFFRHPNTFWFPAWILTNKEFSVVIGSRKQIPKNWRSSRIGFLPGSTCNQWWPH